MATATKIIEHPFAFDVIQPATIPTVSKIPKGSLTAEELGKETRKKLKAYCKEHGIS